MNTEKNVEIVQITQFELTKDVLLRLNEFEITPVAKLVLLYLTSCYNPANSVSVFPKVETIASTLGLGLTATKSAIAQLINEGIVIKGKQKRSGNYNKYSLTGRVVKRTSKSAKSDFLNSRKTTVSCNNKKEEQKTQHDDDSKKLYSDEDLKLLKDYAEKNAKTNPMGYYNKLVSTDCTLLLKKIKAPILAEKRKQERFAESKDLLKLYKSYEIDSVPPPAEFFNLKKKLAKELGKR